MTPTEDARIKAEEALTAFFALVIREDEDPDHSGPEDAAAVLADEVVGRGYLRLTSMDWKDLLE